MAGRGRPKKVQNQDETMVITNVIQNETNEIIVTPEVTDITTFELSAEITAGKLTSNAKELETIVKNELQNYTVEKFIGNPEGAAKEKAKLNKLSDAIAQKRREISNLWNKPLDEFLSTMKGLEKTIKDASTKLKTITDEAENKIKEEKKSEIIKFYDNLSYKPVALEKIFNIKWLNKTYSMQSIMVEIENEMDRISAELATLKSMQDEDSEILMSFYLDTLDLNATLQKGNQLKANRAALKAQEEQTAKNVEKDANSDEICINSAKNDKKTAENEQIQVKKEEILSFRLELFGTAEKLIALRKFIDANGISYKKI